MDLYPVNFGWDTWLGAAGFLAGADACRAAGIPKFIGSTADLVRICRPECFRLIFIDGDHEPGPVQADVGHALGWLCQGGVLVLHDAFGVGALPGPASAAAVLELFMQPLSGAGTLACFQRSSEREAAVGMGLQGAFARELNKGAENG